MSGSVVVEDMANGLNEWRNIQEVVRFTFKYLTEKVHAQEHTLAAQAEAISRLERMLEQKASRGEMQGLLAQKANATDIHGINRRLTELNKVLDSKAEASEVVAMLDRKADLSEVADQFSEVIHVLDAKADVRLVEEQLRRKANAEEMALVLERKANREEMLLGLAEKASLGDVQKATRVIETKASVADVNALLEQVARSIENLSSELGTKADARDVVAELDKKVHISDLQSLLDLKANIVDVNESLNLKANKDAVAAALQLKANAAAVEEQLASKASIADVNTVLAKKADVDLVNAALEKKATPEAVAELLEARIAELNAAFTKELYGRPSAADLEGKLAAMEHDIAHTQDVVTTLAPAADLNALKRDVLNDKHEMQNKLAARVSELQLNNTLGRTVAELRAEINSLSVELNSALAGKISNAQLSDALTTTMTKAVESAGGEAAAARAHELEELRSHLAAQLATKAHKRDVDDVLEKMERLREATIAELESKVEISKFDDAVVNMNEAINRELMNMTGVINTKVDASTMDTNLRLTVDSLESNVVAAIREQTAATMSVMDEALETSGRELRAELDVALASKANVKDVASLLAGKADARELAELEARLFGPADSASGAAGRPATTRDLDELKHELQLKASLQDVITLTDAKASVDDVNRALASVTNELAAKAPLADVARIDSEQGRVLEALSAELMVGRWLWKSGKTKGGHGIPWNVQILNSAPDVFVWGKDKVNLVATLPGLYQVSAGFFSAAKPSIQLLVNGEPVLSAVNSSSYVIHHSSGRLAAIDDHPSGNVTGLTLIDFLSLPANARIALSYKGEAPGEGFLELRKL
ncbi:uncharacterized protein AMSG_02023 [Thecamonas trahens ATCC 50062]|uniref:C1q domain-containing protein n=1 Tax=Thecamonas trahens ATCC 50062 TaxID=461836 RepID=A0A0L0DV86_THETB|nr:hypothetical protein AMSG_02023 [Thecamonas trahens ATCC 50062]KNC56011.1 hypothetical protein AMSG_02023 [Thecamonas trahens ATCC 50062]|eukprot:XP_013761055.1 hypothetical protein AMSG_02023 [Thecamonas trahens ATCC 50062]